MEFVLNFFDGFTWQVLVGFLFTAIFALWPGFNLFNWLKDKFNLVDQAANAMVVGVSILITALAMFVTNSLGIESLDFTLESILAFAGFLYGASQIAYQRFKANRAEVELEVGDWPK